MPFPIKNRDLVVRYIRKQDAITGVVTTMTEGAPDKIPHKEEFIRIPHFSSHYIIEPSLEGYLDMEYYLKIDPGGTLPSWLVNLAATTGPLSTMKGLYRIIESGRYKGIPVEGIDN